MAPLNASSFRQFPFRTSRDHIADLKNQFAAEHLAAARHLVAATHPAEKDALGRVNGAIIFGLVGSGLAACAIGATIYDAARLIAAW